MEGEQHAARQLHRGSGQGSSTHMNVHRARLHSLYVSLRMQQQLPIDRGYGGIITKPKVVSSALPSFRWFCIPLIPGVKSFPGSLTKLQDVRTVFSLWNVLGNTFAWQTCFFICGPALRSFCERVFRPISHLPHIGFIILLSDITTYSILM